MSDGALWWEPWGDGYTLIHNTTTEARHARPGEGGFYAANLHPHRSPPTWNFVGSNPLHGPTYSIEYQPLPPELALDIEAAKRYVETMYRLSRSS